MRSTGGRRYRRGMRALRFLPHVVASLLVGLASLPAQRPSSWRCAHVLAEDGASWRDDMVVETLLSNIILVRPARRDECACRAT